MKTNLNRQISTSEHANEFIKELFKNDELFHFDDPVEECLEGIVSKSECKKVEELLNQIFALQDYDPFELACELTQPKTEEPTLQEVAEIIVNKINDETLTDENVKDWADLVFDGIRCKLTQNKGLLIFEMIDAKDIEELSEELSFLI